MTFAKRSIIDIYGSINRASARSITIAGSVAIGYRRVRGRPILSTIAVCTLYLALESSSALMLTYMHFQVNHMEKLAVILLFFFKLNFTHVYNLR